MAIYYQITAPEVAETFDSKEKVCMYIRAKKISRFKVYMKDNSQVHLNKLGSYVISALPPMCEDITSEIESILAHYDKLEKNSQ